MKSIGVSNDLPEYLKSKYSVCNPSKRASTAHKAYKTPLRQGVSEESPRHFQVSFVPVLDPTQKNEAISNDLRTGRFLSNLKKNLPRNKPRFDYCETIGQKFDYDTLKFVEGMDVKAGHSARIARLMGYNEMYNKTLNNGFGLPRGDFVVELAQPNVSRFEGRQVGILKNYLSKTGKKLSVSVDPSDNLGAIKGKGKVKDYSLAYQRGRNVNTPNRKLRTKKCVKSESVSLVELDHFEANIKSKQSIWNSTAMYKEF